MRLTKWLISLFSKHPNEIGMSYLGHFFRALIVAFILLKAFAIITIHAIFPFIFVHNVSKIIESLHIELNHGQKEF